MFDYLPYITIAEYLLTLICSIFSTYFFGIIFYWNTFKKISLGMNMSMKLYVIVEFLFSIVTVIYSIYFTIFWRPVENIYNAYIIFFTSAGLSIFLVTEPLVACFLGIDRCICIIFPFKKLWSKIITLLTIFNCLIFAGLIILYNIATGWPTTAQTICRSFSCLQTSNGHLYAILRSITSVASVIIGAVLIRLFKFQTNQNSNLKNTRLVIITVVSAIIFDFFPHLISVVLSSAYDISLTKHIGPYSTLVSALNSFVCGRVYYRAMKASLSTVTHQIGTAFIS